MVSKSHKTEDLTFNNLGIFILKLIASDTTNGCRCMVSLQDPCEVWDPLYEPAFVSIIELPQNPWHNYISRVMENTRHDHLVRTLCNPIVIPGGSNQRTSDKLADQFVMSISPNPVEGDDLVVDFESQNQNSITNISITDLNGKVLLITKLMGTRKVTINVASLNSGIYIIKALSNDQTLRTSKFIKL
ncbi:MAG: T9SS type A sorting domain-containing protein [Saprospiraceae bacterium]|nr:T9SS type A sorting domain-containing protein [Candidatus Vicinibacter affinis]MBK6573979.1 T9SS type A sorting domain-containing protein [Candidatus Vicinibacter affinis]MBK6821568.1 T9SS type A sorting domain-containing protein [Candidatus Vicinibacter affinis]MBK7800011.1 T9SS type A sorting domain-containing protein [Candidatus Vicinibacter affinis]